MFDLPCFEQYRRDLIQHTHGDETIPDGLWILYDALAHVEYLTHTSLAELNNVIREKFYPELSFNQVRKRIFAAMGYRSTGLAEEIRLRYTQRHELPELHYPNLWIEFTKGFHESIFGADIYGNKQYRVAYLEMLYEPYLRHYQSSEDNAQTFMAALGQARQSDPERQIMFFDKEQFINGFYLYVDLAQDKTATVGMLRQWAKVFHEIVGISYTDGLNMAATAMGYKAWAPALKTAVDESITNQRYTWAYA